MPLAARPGERPPGSNNSTRCLATLARGPRKTELALRKTGLALRKMVLKRDSNIAAGWSGDKTNGILSKP